MPLGAPVAMDPSDLHRDSNTQSLSHRVYGELSAGLLLHLPPKPKAAPGPCKQPRPHGNMEAPFQVNPSHTGPAAQRALVLSLMGMVMMPGADGSSCAAWNCAT